MSIDQEYLKHSSQVPLLETQEMYRLLVEAVRDYAIFMLNPTGIITTWNMGAERIKGYYADEIIGKHFSCFYTSEDIQAGKPEYDIQLAQSSKNGFENEGWQVRKDGSKFWANILFLPIYSKSGTLIGFSRVTRDLSERKQAEEKFEESLKELKDIKFALDQSTIVAMTNQKGDITYVNEAFCRISKYSEDELIGQNHRIINSGHHPHEFFINMWKTIASGNVWKNEIKNRAKDGTYYWVDTTIVPFVDPQSGKPYQYVAIRHDITSQKTLELELEQAKEMAEQANKKKSQFLTNMSHELRTPLNAVISYSQMMKQGIAGEMNEKQLKYANNIEVSGKHLLDMVNDILDIAKIEAGKIQLSLQPICLENMILELQDIFTDMAKHQKVQLEFHIAPELKHITADPIRLRQIFFNLISNAIKFNRENGQVNVKIFIDSNKQWLIGEIQDTGIGIPAEKLEELFTEFYQIDSSMTRLHEGTGLGLALTKRLVKLHGGDISVTSKYNIGSTFSFHIPLVPK